MSYATTWINFEDIMLNEISQSQRDKYCMIPLLRKLSKVTELLEGRMWVPRSGRKGGRGVVAQEV